MRKPDKQKPIYPIWGCGCEREGAILLEGNLDYERRNARECVISKPYCRACNGSGTIKTHYLPTQFFLRVRGCEQDFGDAYAAKDPYFPGYFATGFIQYNEATKHFRYVRIDFTRATIIGTNGITKNKVTGLKEEVLNALGWKNYMIAYTSKNSPKEYEGPQPNPLMPDNYDVGLFGGTDEWRVLMWNLRSMAKATRAAKKRLIRGVAPLIAMINEGRQEF